MNFTYTPEIIDALELTLSTDRLSKYMDYSGGDREKSIRLYVKNTKISESFYSPLQGLEVCIRNAIHTSMSERFGERWYDLDVAPLRHPLTEKIESARNVLDYSQKEITPGRMVAELNFGFWVGILGSKYETSLWRTTLRHAFPNRAKGFERKNVHGALNAIRRLRNRVAHHEPILHRDLARDHDLIISAISWVCLETARWVEAHSRFHKVH